MLGPDGEKYACEACIRGHRVSNCNHVDRELKHIAKKGRPVTQCTHCRSLRKSRSAHVKCECGEKHHAPKEKCCHLKAQENGLPMPPLERSSSDEHCCRCHNGEKCTCALKRDPADLPTLAEEQLMPEASTVSPARAPVRPKLYGSHTADNHLTVINGHHKPLHRHNNAAHECGMPYKIPPHHSHGMHHIGHRSSDSLPLSLGADRGSLSTTPDLQSLSDSPFTPDMQASPPQMAAPTSAPSNNNFNDFGNLSSNAAAFANMTLTTNVDGFPDAWNNASVPASATDLDMPLPSAGSDVAPAYWSGSDLPLVPSVTNPSQPPSWAGESNQFFPQPALTAASSSGPQSEIDESMSMPMDELSPPSLGITSNNTPKEPPLPPTSQPYLNSTEESFPSFDPNLAQESEDKSNNNRWSLPVSNGFCVSPPVFNNSMLGRPSNHLRSESNPVPPARPASIHTFDQYDYNKMPPTSNSLGLMSSSLGPNATSNSFLNGNWMAQYGLDLPSNSNVSSFNYNNLSAFAGLGLDFNSSNGTGPSNLKVEDLNNGFTNSPVANDMSFSPTEMEASTTPNLDTNVNGTPAFTFDIDEPTNDILNSPFDNNVGWVS